MIKNSYFPQGFIQETMFVPFYARATFSKLYPELLEDSMSFKILKKLDDVDFSRVKKYLTQYNGLIYIERARNFDNALKKYMKKYPNTTVVNLGAGLDTTFNRIDNGNIKFYDLDLPDAIEYRKKFIPETPRNRSIAKSIFDQSWFDDVEFQPERGIFLIAGGLFGYFKEDKIAGLVHAMARRFPGGELIFDGVSQLLVLLDNKKKERLGYTGYLWKFPIKNPEKQFPNWSKKIKVVEHFLYWEKTPRNPKWSLKTHLYMRFSNLLKLQRIVHLRFLK